MNENLVKTVGPKTLVQWTDVFKQFLVTIDDQFDPGHRLDHVERVVKNALQLAAQEIDACYEVILPAVWLHDCVPISKQSPQRAQASRLSADRAVVLLQELNYPAQYYDAIAHAIKAHSYSANIAPETLEAKIVQDADRLDSLGAIGIARVFLVGGELRNTIYPPDKSFDINRSFDEKQYIVDHFYTKLLHLAPSFHTESGRAEAQRRTDYMRLFLQQLAGEVGIEPSVESELDPASSAG